MSFLYLIFIAPIELFYSFTYMFLHEHMNYGLAILALSCITYILLIPVHKIAQASQQNERLIQTILQPQLQNIRTTSKGAERQARISGLYKRYAYHPLYAVRSAFGMVLQLPFLAAAYNMLTHYEPIWAERFDPIRDLGQPDGLLWGINALPILMTLINLASVFTSKGLARREIVQSCLLAAFFFVLLYNAPSALLLFWSMNNLLFLLSNLYKKFIQPRLVWPSFAFLQGDAASIVFYKNTYILASLSMLLLIFFYLPSRIYISDPAYFFISLMALFQELLPLVVLSIFALFTVWSFSPARFKPAVTFFSVTILCMSLLNIFVFNENYGTLDGFLLSGQKTLYDNKGYDAWQSLYFFLLQPLIPSLVVSALIFFRRVRAQVTGVLTIISISAFFVVAYNSFEARHMADAFVSDTQTLTRKPYMQSMQEYSKDDENIAIFILDAFSAGHMQRILEDSWFHEDVAEELDGFVWYPNVVTTGSATILSLPGLYGGEHFSPSTLNEAHTENHSSKFTKAYAHLANIFAKANYDVHMVNGLYLFDEQIFAEKTEHQDNITAIPYVFSDFNKEVPSVATNKFFISAISLFQISPVLVKRAIYDDGQWLGAEKAAQTNHMTINELAFFSSLMQENIVATKKESTFKYFYTRLSHYSWHLEADAFEISVDPYPLTKGQITLIDNVIPEHYYTGRHMMRLIFAYLKKLKEIGVYDNTRIIFVADHCYGDSNMSVPIFGENPDGTVVLSKNHKYWPGRPHGLLLVKEAQSRGRLSNNNAFMTSSDIPALALQSLKNVTSVPEDPRHIKDGRILYHAVGEWNIQKHPKEQFTFELYEVRDSLFDSKNWHKVLEK